MKSMKNLNRREHLRPTLKYTLRWTWLAKPNPAQPTRSARSSLRTRRIFLCVLSG